MKAHDDPEIAGETPTTAKLRRSPLTDPRALVVSLAIHALLLTAASILAFSVVAPVDQASGSGGTIRGELESTDNRARDESGGSSGAPEGRAVDVSAEPGIPAPPSVDPAAQSLLSEILPTRESAELTTQTLPGPSTSGLGMLNSSGSGENGGDASGNAGPTARGSGPGTEFFGMRDKGGSYAYVIDCSGSMYLKGSLDVAKRELLASLAQIPAEAKFAVVFYNLDANVFTDPEGKPGLMAATPANKARVRTLLASVRPDGGTDHTLALHTAFALHPEVIFFLTDADFMTRQDVPDLVARAGRARIQTVEFGQVGSVGGSPALKLLSKTTGGSYRYIDINALGR